MQFIYTLALALGKTKQELLEQLDNQELIEWQAFYRINPFGLERQDLHAGIVASTVANVNRGKRKAFKVSEFMPRFLEKQTKRGAGDLLDKIKLINARLGGTVK